MLCDFAFFYGSAAGWKEMFFFLHCKVLEKKERETEREIKGKYFSGSFEIIKKATLEAQRRRDGLW